MAEAARKDEQALKDDKRAIHRRTGKAFLSYLGAIFIAGLLFGVSNAQEPPRTGELPIRGGGASPVSSSTTTTSSTTSSSGQLPSSSTVAPLVATTTLPPATGTTYYLSPSGNDGNSGASGSPWKTFGRVFNSGRPLQAGDTVALLDGTYERTTTGLPSITCGSNANDGTSAKPITIRAVNERKAFLKGDGQQTPFKISNCDWWVVVGLRAQNVDYGSSTPNSTAQGDGFVFLFRDVKNLKGYRLLGRRNNRMQNTHIYAVENSQHVLLEECEAYDYHRHGFSIWKSRYVTLRRIYANSLQTSPRNCCGKADNRSHGDEGVSLYGTSDSIVENMISENYAGGFEIHGIANPLDPSGKGGRRNQVLGSIALDESVPAFNGTRGEYNARDTLFRDVLVVNADGNCIFPRGAFNTMVENVTCIGTKYGILGNTGDVGLGASCTSSDEGCSLRVLNALVFGNDAVGITADFPDWITEYSNSFDNRGAEYGSNESISDDVGKIRRSLSVGPTGMGLGAGQCLIRVPSGSNMKGTGKSGADIGANIVDRYVDGTLTRRPLWNADGSFPCGAVIPGVNDGPRACRNVHERLRVVGCL